MGPAAGEPIGASSQAMRRKNRRKKKLPRTSSRLLGACAKATYWSFLYPSHSTVATCTCLGLGGFGRPPHIPLREGGARAVRSWKLGLSTHPGIWHPLVRCLSHLMSTGRRRRADEGDGGAGRAHAHPAHPLQRRWLPRIRRRWGCSQERVKRTLPMRILDLLYEPLAPDCPWSCVRVSPDEYKNWDDFWGCVRIQSVFWLVRPRVQFMRQSSEALVLFHTSLREREPRILRSMFRLSRH